MAKRPYLLVLLLLAACGGPQGTHAPSPDTLVLRGEATRGLLVDITFDPSALRYLGLQSPLLTEVYQEAGQVRLAGVSYQARSGEVLRVQFQVLRPGARPEVRVLEAEATRITPSWEGGGPAPQGQLASQGYTPLPGIAQNEVEASFAQNPLGDLNGSGGVSLSDALLLADLLTGAASPTPYRRYHADLDSSGYADEQDLVRLLRKVVNPNLGPGLEVAPLALNLNPGETALVLVGNSGHGTLPPLTFQAAEGLVVQDTTPSGYAGKVYRVSANQSVSQGAILFSAGSAGSRAIAVNSTAPDFVLSLSGTPTAPVGGTAQATLTLTPLNGFTGPVNLSLVNPPSGILLSPTQVSLGPNPLTLALTLALAPSLSPQDYALTLRAEGGGRVREASFTLRATGFTLSGDTALTLPWGGSGSLQVNVTPQNGFNTPLDLTLTRQDGTPPPPGIALSGTTLPASGGPVALQVQNPPPGTYPLRLRATPQGGGTPGIWDFTLTVTYASEWRILLSWNNAADLDLHLFYPDSPAANHIYWNNPGTCPPTGPACLEGDTPQGPGQETLRFAYQGGSYRVYVHWYFGGGSWSTSGAQVQVFNAGYPVANFPAPTSGVGYNTWWHVLTLDANGVQQGSGVASIQPQGLGLSPLNLPQKGR
ncbi:MULTISPECIES: hypothetical protein [Thermus]|uniref:hypothetical protein n=1 Tax=Thermus TaxID=270 RepID=UPI00036AAC95|nr:MULTISPECIES: hypothetical protein [Thermus]KHG64388.1 hypothetical protein QT17_12635 [Thermus sp. 2.9]